MTPLLTWKPTATCMLDGPIGLVDPGGQIRISPICNPIPLALLVPSGLSLPLVSSFTYVVVTFN
jgi:hypothetical protein